MANPATIPTPTARITQPTGVRVSPRKVTVSTAPAPAPTASTSAPAPSSSASGASSGASSGAWKGASPGILGQLLNAPSGIVQGGGVVGDRGVTGLSIPAARTGGIPALALSGCCP